MKYIRSVLLIVALVLSAACAHNPKPTIAPAVPVHIRIEQSIARVTQHLVGETVERGVCTAFSIGPNRFMTAAHCVDEAIMIDGMVYLLTTKVDGYVAKIVSYDADLDLAVVVAGLDKPALHLRSTDLEHLEQVYAMGFGHGFRYPLLTEQRAMFFGYLLSEGIWPGTIFMYPFVGGMSGGPIYDNDGWVVGIVQRASAYIGYSVDLKMIRAFLGE